MGTRRTGVVLTGIATGLLLTACGGGGSSSRSDGSSPSVPAVTAADLDGSTFESTGVEGHDLVPDSTVTTDGDTAEFAPAGITRMACPPPADEVEQSVLTTLDGKVTVTADGSTATLTNGRHGPVLKAG